jgi:Fe-S oxidoreductase
MTIAPGEEARLAKEGFSCRQQIVHGTQPTASHPVQLVREALADEAGP